MVRYQKHDPAGNGGPDKGGAVLLYCCKPSDPQGHEYLTQSEIARQLAAIKGYAFAGEFDPARSYGCPLYFVPSDTLVTADSARALGVACEQDLFGGVVPFPFLATKAITHDLPPGHARAPEGWSSEFARLVGEDVLPGFSAFFVDDARRAGLRLLERGKLRVKKASGLGGLGQWVVTSPGELDACLDAIDADELQRDGVVLEANLNQVVTYSVGRARVGGMVATYCGTQRLTTNNRGEKVYGGSSLLVVRGDFDVLLRLDLDDRVRTAVRQACAYHAAALAAYPGIFASRANYDVAQGIDDAGQWHSGVLEQSWRIGGASAAELAALAAFKAAPAMRAVRASTVEVYGEHAEVPREAAVHYRGVDERAGPLTKYSLIESHANT